MWSTLGLHPSHREQPEDMRASVKHAHQLQRWRSQRWPGQLELINRLHGLKSVCTLSSHRPDYKDQMIFTARKWSQKIYKWLLQTQLYKPQQHGAHSGSEELKMTRFHTHHECLIIFWMVMSREPARSVKKIKFQVNLQNHAHFFSPTLKIQIRVCYKLSSTGSATWFKLITSESR